MIDIIYTPSQTIFVIIYGSFQYLHNMKKQVKIEEKFKAFVTANLKKKLYGPFLWMGFNYLKARATSRRQFTFYH